MAGPVELVGSHARPNVAGRMLQGLGGHSPGNPHTRDGVSVLDLGPGVRLGALSADVLGSGNAGWYSADGGDVPGDKKRHGLASVGIGQGGHRRTMNSSSLRPDEDQWWYCLRHQRVEQGTACRATDRMGPYAEEASARAALQTAAQRTQSWDADQDDDQS